MTLGFIELLDIISFISGATISILLCSRSRRSIAYCFLAAFLFTYVSGALVPVMFRGGLYVENPFWIYFPINLSIFSLAILHGFLKTLSGEFSWNKIGWTLIIPLFVTSSQFYFWSLPVEEKIIHLSNGQWNEVYYTYRTIAFCYSLLMIGITLRAVKLYQKKVDQFYSEGLPPGFRWVKTICYFILAIMVPIMLPQSLYPEGVFPIIAVTFLCLGIVLVIWIGIEGMNQEFMYLTPEFGLDDSLERSNNSEVSSSEEDNPNILQSGALDKIIVEMRAKQLYRLVDLNLNQLSSALNIPTRRLSNLINNETGKNFRNFINAFRVEHAKKELEAGALDRMNMNGLAQEAGFKSRTTFYSAFKQEVGTTPLEYLQENKKKQDEA